MAATAKALAKNLERMRSLADPRSRRRPTWSAGGWVLMDLTTATPDWAEVDELIRTSYCLIAPKKLAAQFGER